MAGVVSSTLQGNELEAVRYQLETVGYAESTIVCEVTGTSAVTATIDGLSLGTTIPVPPDSAVSVTFTGAIFYDDNGTESSETINIMFAASRDGTANVVLMDEIGGNGDYLDLAAQMSHITASSGALIDVTLAADSTNQGIDLNFDCDAADDTAYIVGRAVIVCAKNGGFYKAYVN